MIFVTVGTQKQPFNRLIDMIDQLDITTEVLIQSGYSRPSQKYQSFSFSQDCPEKIAACDILITHGGVGSIMAGLLAKKLVFAMARKAEYGEHVDDHQQEIIDKLVNQGYIYEFSSAQELEELIKSAPALHPKIFQSKSDEFNANLNQEINNMFKGE